MSARTVIAAAALMLLLGVAAGAFGAHALRSRLEPDLLGAFQTGVQYHLVHALGALIVGVLWILWPEGARSLGLSAVLLLVGVLLFSGSLYLLAVTGIRWLGAITPLGGISWLLGWAALAYAALSR